MDTWAEVRRLHRCEGLPIKEIARRLDLARNTVRAALRADVPPSRERPPRGTVADAYEPAIRALLLQFPRMSATVIAERIEWPYSITPLKRKLRVVRPEYVGVDPADRLSFAAGEVGQLDLWQPDYEVPVGFGQQRKLWVLAMTLGSRMTDTVVLPGRLGGDLLSGMWWMMARLGPYTNLENPLAYHRGEEASGEAGWNSPI